MYPPPPLQLDEFMAIEMETIQSIEKIERKDGEEEKGKWKPDRCARRHSRTESHVRLVITPFSLPSQ